MKVTQQQLVEMEESGIGDYVINETRLDGKRVHPLEGLHGMEMFYYNGIATGRGVFSLELEHDITVYQGEKL